MGRALPATMLLLMLVLAGSTARAAITSDSTAFGVSTGASGSTTLAWSHTVGTGSNRILLVGISFRSDTGSGGAGGNTYVTGVTFGSTSLTCLAARDDNSTGGCGSGGTGTPIYLRGEVWYLLNPTSGTATITVTTNNATVFVGESASYSGVASAGTGGVSASNNGQTGSTTPSLGPITSPAGDLVFNNMATARSAGNVTCANTALSATTPPNQDSVTTAYGHIEGAISQSTVTNPTMSWTLTNTSPWSMTAAVLTPAPPKRKGQTIVGELRAAPGNGPAGSTIIGMVVFLRQFSDRVISNLAIANPRSQNRALGHPIWYKT